LILWPSPEFGAVIAAVALLLAYLAALDFIANRDAEDEPPPPPSSAG
jgi:hypothetical protein